MPDLDLRALVTGASSGIGAAFARALRSRGERLVLVARREDRLKSLAQELGGAPDVVVITADLAAPDGPARLQAEVESAGFQIDFLVNNAGSGDTGPFAEQSVDRLRGMIDLNARALVELTRRFLPGMLERRRGRIINVVSNGAFQPVPYLNVYAATKSLVLFFTEGLATELEGTGVRIQALCPGLTETEFFDVARTSKDLLVNRLPRMTPEEVVACSLQALDKGRLRVVPGLSNRILASLVRVAPRSLARRIAARLYRPRYP
jgi:short-subunit dehydrogenase